MKHIIILLSIIVLCGCSSEPLTPEEVIREYTELMSNGDCEEAKILCTGDTKQPYISNVHIC